MNGWMDGGREVGIVEGGRDRWRERGREDIEGAT